MWTAALAFVLKGNIPETCLAFLLVRKGTLQSGSVDGAAVGGGGGGGGGRGRGARGGQVGAEREPRTEGTASPA